MTLTDEQKAIINSTGNIKINAVAGSGKTTTIIEYARTRPAGSRILYLAFNKSVKLDAARKFAAKGLGNVRVETAHSLAFAHIVFQSNYKVRAQAYKISEIVTLLHLQGNGEKHTEFVIANHISRFIAYFCNSDKQKVQDLDYLETITDDKVKAFVTLHYPYIVKQTRLLLAQMDKGAIEITHDFYLKKFQIAQPTLGYDYILFDEGQDASAAMLDVFLKQKATKVIVGDTHQQIYGWRFAVNSLEKAHFKTFHLSTSFRFGQSIAHLAMEVLKLKDHIGTYKAIAIRGKGNNTATKTRAILARTNLGLLLKAIEYVTEHKSVKHIYFEGNINSYTYADEGTSLYDVLNLRNGKHHLIRDMHLKTMEGLGELEEYIEKTEDVQLSMMVEIVKEYGNEIPEIIQAIKNKHVSNEEKEKATVIFSTVHRCKGMEYDVVELVDDFISEKKLVKLAEGKGDQEVSFTKLNEEINLLYVAVTRAKNKIEIQESLLSKLLPESPHIKIVENTPKEERKQKMRPQPSSFKKPLPSENSMKSKEAYKPWTEELDEELTELFSSGMDGAKIARHFNRTNGSIAARVKKLGLDDLYS